MSTNSKSHSESTRERIKREARLLFATRGIDGVSTREIMKASGQKNTASLGYYFGSKENLVREIIVDGAKIIDERRNVALNELESSGGPRLVREVTDILIFTAVRMSPENPSQEDSYSRFITHIGQHHPELFMNTLGDKWLGGFTRCLQHLRNFMPPMPDVVKTQRIQFIASYLGAVLSMREHALAGDEQTSGLWSLDGSLHHFSQTMAAVVEQSHDDAHFNASDLSDTEEDERVPAMLGVSVI